MSRDLLFAHELEAPGPFFALREPGGPLIAGGGGDTSFSWRKFHGEAVDFPGPWDDFAFDGSLSGSVVTPKLEECDPIPAPAGSLRSDRAGWDRLCHRAEQAIFEERVAKIVPARMASVSLTDSERRSILSGLSSRLFAGPQGNTFRFLLKSHESIFFGATPELLFRRDKGTLLVPAIAGTRALVSGRSEESLGEELMSSEKDRREHALVIQGICETLSSLGFVPRAPAAPEILRAPGLLHLYSAVTAKDLDSVPCEELISRLHPTPAIGGYPAKMAMEFLVTNENWDRGLFSAPLLVKTKDYEFCLVAIRSALLTRNELHFFAGAGYVKGSTPESEWLETEKKLQVMQKILFGDAHGK